VSIALAGMQSFGQESPGQSLHAPGSWDNGCLRRRISERSIASSQASDATTWEGWVMSEAAEHQFPAQNPQVAKERQDWLALNESVCRDLGGTNWQEWNREELLAKVEKQLWEVLRAKGMHHVTFRRKCRIVRELLTP